ncbi:MAG: RHS repeat-associated core domain-containing protein, partial [Patescibacteria group bacterium]
NVVMKRDGNGDEIVYRYDALNRVREKILPEGTTVSYTYDNWNNILSVSGAEEDAVYAYDKENRRTNEERRPAGLAPRSYAITRAYTPDGKVQTLTDVANIAITYAYDTRGLLETVKRADAEFARYTYTSFGAPETLQYGNGTQTQYTYDPLHRMTRVTVVEDTATLFDEAYEYDREGNRTALFTNGTSTAAYFYDPLNQLTDVNYLSFTGESGDIDSHFEYDAFGNRTALRDLGGDTRYAYNAASGQLSSYIQNDRLQTSVTYDANGATISETITRLGQPLKTITYDWDSQHRLRFLSYQTDDESAHPRMPATVLSFAYDDAGNRIKKSVGTDTTYYLNDGVRVLNELNADGAVTKSIIYGLGTIAEVDNLGVLTYVHEDVLGSAALLTDDTGASVQRYEYEPFGAIMGMDGTRETKYLFTGQEFDPESELYYYNARYYNPATGRFISRDPIRGFAGDVLAANAYIYVRNNPLRYVDPTGMLSLGGAWDSFVNGVSAVGDAVVDTANAVGDVVVETSVYVANKTVEIANDAYEFTVDTAVNIKNAACANVNCTAIGTGLLEGGKTILDFGSTVAEGIAAGGALAGGQPQAATVLGVGALGNLDNAMVNSTNALNNIINGFQDKPAEKLITQGPYRDFVESVVGDTELFDKVQMGA